MAEIRLAAAIQTDSVVDGKGLRCVLWTQGCPHNCPGCHNPETLSLTEGFLETVENICQQLDCLDYHDGLTISGGEPFLQAENLLPVIRYARDLGLNIWLYSGYTIEELIARNDKHSNELLKNIDVLVDGRFVRNLFSFELEYIGSSNQRIIDIKEYFEGS